MVVEPNKSQATSPNVQKHKLDKLPSLVQLRKPISQNTVLNSASQDDLPLADLHDLKYKYLFCDIYCDFSTIVFVNI